MGRAIAASVAVVATAVLPASASAETRYVSATGAGIACSQAAPCTFATAVNGGGVAQNGDTVIIGSGTYNAAGAITITRANLDIVAAPEGTRPVLNLNSATQNNGLNFNTSAAGTKLRGVRVNSPNGASAIRTSAAITLDDIEIYSQKRCLDVNTAGVTVANSDIEQWSALASDFCIVAFQDNFTIRDTAIRSHHPTSSPLSLWGDNVLAERLTIDSEGSGASIQVSVGDHTAIRQSRITAKATGLSLFGDGAVASDTVVRTLGANSTAVGLSQGRLRNVTAIANGTGSRGLYVPNTLKNSAWVASVRNTILRGEAADLKVDGAVPADPTMCGIDPVGCLGKDPVDLTITHSNFRPDKATGPLNAASSNNSGATPLFVDPVSGDFRPAAGSPTIDAGTTDPDNGAVDAAGKPRAMGAAVDVGAFEFEPPPSNGGGGGDGGGPGGGTGGGGGPGGGVADTVKPVFNAVSLTNKTFAVGSGSTPVNAARAKKGTTFKYTLTEDARVTITIERATTGRRSGSKCVKTTRRNVKKRKCTRYAKAGTLTRPGKAGMNSLAFTGRIGKKKLGVGRYRATFAATDTAGNAAAKKTASFTIVRR